MDQQAQGRTPWTGELPLGKHQLSFSLPGYETSTQESQLAERSQVVEVKLAPTPVVAPPPVASLPPAATTTTSQKAEPQRVWTWVVAGAAAATLVAAVGCGIAAQSSSDQMRGKVHDQKTVQSLHDQAQTNATASNVLLGLGLAGAAAGGVLFFVGTF
ncbi:MAG: PEGA domain-containing protein [Myxococcales bacterium]